MAGRDRTDRNLLWSVVGIAVGGGIALRFLPMTPLWLDEAQSAAIAGDGISGLVEALRHDGHPPLYYLLLMGWSSIFGDGGAALRALSGSLGVVALGLTWMVARCHLDRRGAAVALAAMASSPFAIRYSTEVRMYALIIVLLLAGHLILVAAWHRSEIRQLVGVTGITAALLFTHYWSLFLVAVMSVFFVGLTLRGTTPVRRTARRMLGAIALGCLPFTVWLPVLASQLAHTGTPWASAPRPTVVAALTLESFGGGRGSEALLVAVVISILVAWGIGSRSGSEGAYLGWTDLRWLRTFVLVGGATVVVGTSLSLITDSAFQGRYAVYCFVPMILAMTVGILRLPGRAGPVALVVLMLLSGVSVVRELNRDRTQVGVIAEAVVTGATAGDHVVFCPDQLAPAGHRLLGEDFSTAAYPALNEGRKVDWYDYEDRNRAANPSEVAEQIVSWSEGAENIWLVWIDGFLTLDGQCGILRTELGKRLGGGSTLVRADGDEFYSPANLVRFPGPGR